MGSWCVLFGFLVWLFFDLFLIYKEISVCRQLVLGLMMTSLFK